MCQDCLFPKIIIRVRDEHIQPLLHQVHVAGSHKLLVKGLGNFWSETTWTQALVSSVASSVIWTRCLKFLCFNFFIKLVNKYGDNTLLNKVI